MTYRKGRVLLILALGAGVLAFIVVSLLPEHPVIKSLTFDVSSSAALEPDCAQKADADLFVVGGVVEGRSYSFDERRSAIFRTVVTYQGGAGEGRRWLYDFVATRVVCGFPRNEPSFLQVSEEKRRTLPQVEELVRTLGQAAGVPAQDIKATVQSFEDGDTWNKGQPGYHTFRLERPGLAIWFDVDDPLGPHEIPARAGPEDARFFVAVGFKPSH